MSPPAGSLKTLGLIGGGRWARVIAGVLLDHSPSDLRLSIHTPGNAAGMRAWVSGRGAEKRAEVLERWPDYGGSRRPEAVIVANAARDHVRAAAEALSAGIPTLVEKPLALSEASARSLIDLAGQNGVRLAVSQVFLFARYVEAFAREVARRAPVTHVRVTWTDPAQETRYGEAKSVDPDLPIVKDVLPHVVSILRVVCGTTIGFVDVALSRGGAQADLRLRLDGTPCSVRLARNGEARRRVIDVETGTGPLQLDFSEEPGRITIDGAAVDGDPAWSSAPRPLALMLKSFLDGVAGGAVDERLDAAQALEACRIADQAMAG
ncbi:MAG: Gfo/Idh/MocA family oxidoreductase [bacterium]